MKELWQNKSKEEWIKTITSLKSDISDITVKNKEEAKKTLREKLVSAVEKRLLPEKYGIFFSGGVDSSLIAALSRKSKKDFICYTVGFQEDTKEPEDVIEAKKTAEVLGFELKYKIFNLKETEAMIRKTVNILKKIDKNDVVNVGVGAVIVAAVELAKKEKINCFFSGLGSEEIFAGYERHSKAADVQEECWRGLINMWDRDLVRDIRLGQELGITISMPFLDQELIKYAMQLPAEWKIDDEKKKIILREVAEEFLGKFAWRKKKAAQYGSCFDKAISKLTRKNGFKMKKDWLEALPI